MTASLTRLQLFRGSRASLRPPWSPAETAFVDRCERCDDCIRVCPQRLLYRGRGGFPEVRFGPAGCDFCGDCRRVCRGRALAVTAEAEGPPWSLKAEIGALCLSMRGVACRVCGEICDRDAIRFRLAPGGVAQPILDLERCSGCGRCYGVCPVGAVAMVQGQNEYL